MQREPASELAYLLDADVAAVLLAHDDAEVGVCPGDHASAVPARAARVAVDGRLAEEQRRERLGEDALADPRGSEQQDGRRHASGGDRPPESRRGALVADHVGEPHRAARSRRSASATIRPRTVAAGAAVSTTHTRSGSAAARAWKPARTRAWKSSVSRSKRSPVADRPRA